MLTVEVVADGRVALLNIDPVSFFVDMTPTEVDLFELAVGAERFAELQAGVVAIAEEGKATPEQLAVYGAPDIIATIVNIKLRRSPDAPVGYRSGGEEIADMREVSLGDG